MKEENQTPANRPSSRDWDITLMGKGLAVSLEGVYRVPWLQLFKQALSHQNLPLPKKGMLP